MPAEGTRHYPFCVRHRLCKLPRWTQARTRTGSSASRQLRFVVLICERGTPFFSWETSLCLSRECFDEFLWFNHGRIPSPCAVNVHADKELNGINSDGSGFADSFHGPFVYCFIYVRSPQSRSGFANAMYRKVYLYVRRSFFYSHVT